MFKGLMLWRLGVCAISFAVASSRAAAASSAELDCRRKLPPQLEAYQEESEIKCEVDKVDREEMVRPAPKGFKPEAEGRKVRLRLAVRDKTIRPGQSVWYRLELQNVGTRPITFVEIHSFLKSGLRYEDGTINFYVTGAGKTKYLMSLGRFADEMGISSREKRPIIIPDSERMTKQQVQDFMRRDHLRRRAEAGLRVYLSPGDTLVSRPWRWETDDEYQERLERGETDLWPRPQGAFRELWTDFDFDKPGRYAIQAEFVDEPPEPPSDDDLKSLERKGVGREKAMQIYRDDAREALGHVLSNRAVVEVAP